MNFILKFAAAISMFYLLYSSSHGAVIGQLGVLDSTANGGLNPTTGMAWKVGDAYRLTFLSSTGTDATSADIIDYNDHVQGLANLVNLGSIAWKAKVSTPTVAARDNTGTNQDVNLGVSIFLMDGLTMVAIDNADLWDGSISSAILFNEKKALESNGAKAFTGTSGDGQADLAVGTGGNVTIGAVGNTGKWVDGGSKSASDMYQIYAVSEVLYVTEAIPEPSSTILVLLGTLLCFRRKRSE